MRPGPNGWSRASRSRRSASARWPMRPGRFFRWWRPPRRCTLRRAACSARRLPRSVSVWSGRWRSASGLDATRALLRLETAAAAVMGTAAICCPAVRYFVVTFILAFPTLLALSRIREHEIDVARAHGAVRADGAERQHQRAQSGAPAAVADLCLQYAAAATRQRRDASADGRRRYDPVGQWAPVLIAACIIVPQAIVALTSPSVGRRRKQWGRRPLLLLGLPRLRFAACCLRS